MHRIHEWVGLGKESGEVIREISCFIGTGKRPGNKIIRERESRGRYSDLPKNIRSKSWLRVFARSWRKGNNWFCGLEVTILWPDDLKGKMTHTRYCLAHSFVRTV